LKEIEATVFIPAICFS